MINPNTFVYSHICISFLRHRNFYRNLFNFIFEFQVQQDKIAQGKEHVSLGAGGKF